MKSLTIKDIMVIGSFAALYFMCVALGTLAGVLLVHSGNMMLAPAFSALFAGTIYMLLISKVKKFGAITLIGAVMAIFFFLSGYFILSFIPNLLCGLVADGLAKIGSYRHKGWNLLSYVVFSFGNLGPIILMWLMRDAYIQKLLDKGKDMTYVNHVMVDFNAPTVAFLSATIIAGALIGGGIGQYMVKKHFMKAGMAN